MVGKIHLISKKKKAHCELREFGKDSDKRDGKEEIWKHLPNFDVFTVFLLPGVLCLSAATGRGSDRRVAGGTGRRPVEADR